ncbi:MAG: S9 family peptidase [Anaerolineaceae bacterium]|nr:S9 family peptidase [Anaerolineaceae bacterium]
MQLPYGMWNGHIDPDLVANRARVSDLKWNGEKGLTFTAKSTLYRKNPGQALEAVQLGKGVYGSVGYGGGDFDVRGDLTVFCSGSDGLFALRTGSDKPIPLTNDRFDRSTPVISPNGRYAAYVTSDGEHDQIALLGLDGYDWPRLWIKGADFYMQPEWSPDGKHFAWAEWDHPEMPWSGSRVMLAEFDPQTMDVKKVQCIAGGTVDPSSQPHFSPDGEKLAYIKASGDWEDLMVYDVMTGNHRVYIKGKNFAFSVPAFTQGNRSYAWFADSSRIAYIKIQGTVSEIRKYDPLSGTDQKISPEHLTSFEQICVSGEGEVAAIAAGPLDFSQVIVMNKGDYQVIYRVSDLKLDPSFISLPREISWKTKGGTMVYGLYYPPCSPDYGWHGAPPAIVQVHGGPTGKADQSFSAETAYFCSLGYAYVRLNYRGSAGYGRKYLESLNGHWGEYDMEDAVSLAKYLGDKGLADPKRLLITGGSAGGFTVLNALTQYPGVYAAGASLYGVSDLFGLARSTWKLELHYTESLTGKLPEAERKYYEWSPLYHAENISVPLAIFQGDKDVVVPKEQSEGLLSRLRVPHVFKLYEGEGHGFRKAEHIKDYLITLHQFLQQYL